MLLIFPLVLSFSSVPTLAGTGLNVDYYGNSALHGTPMRTATAPNLELELDLTAVSERGSV